MHILSAAGCVAGQPCGLLPAPPAGWSGAPALLLVLPPLLLVLPAVLLVVPAVLLVVPAVLLVVPATPVFPAVEVLPAVPVSVPVSELPPQETIIAPANVNKPRAKSPVFVFMMRHP